MGKVTLKTERTAQVARYVLPMDADVFRKHILGMLEVPEEWKSQHSRDYGGM